MLLYSVCNDFSESEYYIIKLHPESHKELEVIYMFDDFHSDEKNRPGLFKEAVSIEAQRIFDTCSERDCISNLTVVPDPCYCLSDSMTVVKARCVEVSNVCIAVDNVPFKNGYYSVDITYTFRITVDAYEQTCTDNPVTIKGTAVWNKRVILYGSKGSIKTFSSENSSAGETDQCCRIVNMPKVTVSVVEPIALETKIECVKAYTGSDTVIARNIVITLGLFSIVQLTRPVSLLIPTYEYCIPDRECSCASESPEEVFGRLEFPTEQFFPSSGQCVYTESTEKNADFPPITEETAE